jgi:hypothetical protein
MRILSPSLASALCFAVLLIGSPGCTKSTTEPSGAASARALGSTRASSLVAPLELELERALPLAISEDFEPSGLLLVDGHLLTVSDKQDSQIFELVLGPETAQVRPFLHFEPPAEEPRPFDFEGLTLGADGALLLVSEARYRVLSVTREGRAAWVTPILQPLGAAAGLFRKRNAALEGVTRLDDGRLLLAAEREPRGLLELPRTRNLREALAWSMPESIYSTPDGRNPDFADLTTFAGSVYALERNSHLIVRIERAANHWLEREAWSYARTENDPRFLYVNHGYGLGEGVAIDASHVFLVLDNNLDRRASDPGDRRPLLFVFKRPSAPGAP